MSDRVPAPEERKRGSGEEPAGESAPRREG